jgi:hypothetical protein
MLNGDTMIYDKDIEEQFNKLFKFDTDKDWIQINSFTREIWVYGSVTARASDITELPIRFAEVSGNFKVTGHFRNLRTLKGFPRKVGRRFTIMGSQIQNLQGGPNTVGEEYSAQENQLITLKGLAKSVGKYGVDVAKNPLQSLEGLHDKISEIILSYDANLPLLRLLLVKHSLILENYDEFVDHRNAPGDQVDKIIKKWRGHGAAGILQCASELNEAGFEGNAEW